MAENTRGGGRMFKATRAADMEAFDRLPPIVRRAICDAAVPFAYSNPKFWALLRASGSERRAASIQRRFPCGGIQGERIPLAPEDAEWLARATRNNTPPRRKEASDE